MKSCCCWEGCLGSEEKVDGRVKKKGMRSGGVAVDLGRLRVDVRLFSGGPVWVAAVRASLWAARRRARCSVAAARASALVLGRDAPAIIDARRRASLDDVVVVDGLSSVGVRVDAFLVGGLVFLDAVLVGVLLTGWATPRMPLRRFGAGSTDSAGLSDL